MVSITGDELNEELHNNSDEIIRLLNDLISLLDKIKEVGDHIISFQFLKSCTKRGTPKGLEFGIYNKDPIHNVGFKLYDHEISADYTFFQKQNIDKMIQAKIKLIKIAIEYFERVTIDSSMYFNYKVIWSKKNDSNIEQYISYFIAKDIEEILHNFFVYIHNGKLYRNKKEDLDIILIKKLV